MIIKEAEVNMHQKIKEVGADFLLVLVAIAWGSTFFIVQDAITQTPVYLFLFWRFFLAALLMSLFSYKYFSHMDIKVLKAGMILGLFMFLGYAFQTFALTYTYSSTVGFITGLNVVIVPLVSYLLLKQKASIYSLLGAIIASIGLYYLSLKSDDLGFSLGEFYALICAAMFALHIVFTGYFSRHYNAYLLVSIQFFTVAFCSLIGSILTQKTIIPANVNGLLINALLITVIFATIFAFWVQTAMQRFTTATKTAIIFTLEPVSAGLFGYLFAHEVLSMQQFFGALLILVGILVAELGSYIALKFFQKKQQH